MSATLASVAVRGDAPKDDGYRGIWYFNQPSGDEHHYKYSGGFATYPQQHVPIAVYSKVAHKTFFCYGGTTPGKRQLLHMVSYFDHETGAVPRPTILLNKQTDDAHDNPTLMLDDAGYIWIFSPAHGRSRPSYIHRSRRPYAIDDFERVLQTNFSYPQPWYVPGRGFVLLHTRYGAAPGPQRRLFLWKSPDGRIWDEPRLLAGIEMGDYQISWRHGTRLGTAFDFHPRPLGLNARSNLYYLETADGGLSWRAADGANVALPLDTERNAALVYDSRAERRLVYLKDLNFDAQGRPVVLYLTSSGYEAGPKNNPRQWRTARWTGAAWEHRPVTTSDHNYDHGSLYIEADGLWRIIAPMEPGAQPYGTGGEIVVWTSRDQGQSWSRLRQLTRSSPYNHTYVRRPLDAHPDFYALWADGHAHEPSPCRLYFTNQNGDAVWKLPEHMTTAFAKPEVVPPADPRQSRDRKP
jgi:hypothetical protein